MSSVKRRKKIIIFKDEEGLSKNWEKCKISNTLIEDSWLIFS